MSRGTLSDLRKANLCVVICGSTRSRLSCPQGTLLPLRTWLGEGRKARTLRKTKLSRVITTTQKRGLESSPVGDGPCPAPPQFPHLKNGASLREV